LSGVPRRSARRETARRASNRRATARQHKDDAEGHIIEGRLPAEPDLDLNDYPQSTTGDIAKELNANRPTIAAELAHLASGAPGNVCGVSITED
jgi:hypothetical protein